MEIKKLPKNKFPKALLEIPQPPEDLWIIGELPKRKINLSVRGWFAKKYCLWKGGLRKNNCGAERLSDSGSFRLRNGHRYNRTPESHASRT